VFSPNGKVSCSNESQLELSDDAGLEDFFLRLGPSRLDEKVAGEDICSLMRVLSGDGGARFCVSSSWMKSMVRNDDSSNDETPLDATL
jgi:hypothetical protein